MSLASFGGELHVVIVGQGGIGRALADLLEDDPSVIRVHRLARPDVDVTDEATLARAAAAIDTPLAMVLVTTGLLHDDQVRPERDWRELDGASLARLFALNATGPALVAKHFLPLLRREDKAVFAALSARVGSIGDNRLGGWYGYRASKAALNQLIRCLAIELARKNQGAVCVGLHPGTVDTGLSKPFQQRVPADRLFTPQASAAHLLNVVDRLTRADSGGVFAWDGAAVPA